MQDYFCSPEYRHGLALLLKGTPSGTKQEVLDKIQEEFLADLPTSRQPSIFVDETERIHSLPGLGSEFWKSSRAHLFSGTLPPVLPHDILTFSQNYNETVVKNTIKFFRTEIGRAVPNNRLQWDKTAVLKNSDGYFIRVPVTDTFSEYQNGERVCEHPTILFHGTRAVNLTGILQAGLHSSELSHGVKGLWLNSNHEAALNWNQSALDYSPGIALEVAAEPEFLRQNRRIKGQGEGKENRHCLELQPGQTLPSATVCALHIGVPKANRITWFVQISELFEHTVKYLVTLPCNRPAHRFDKATIARITIMLHTVTSFRLAYYSAECAMDEDFGGPYESILQAIVPISIAITKFLWIMQLQSVNRRTVLLPKFHMKNLPLVWRLFFTAKWPNLHHWTNWQDIDDDRRIDWRLDRFVSVRPWSPFCMRF